MGIETAIIAGAAASAIGSSKAAGAQAGAGRSQLQSQAAATGSMTDTWANYLDSVMPIYEQAQTASQDVNQQTINQNIGTLRDAETKSLGAANDARTASIWNLRNAETSANALLNPYIGAGENAINRLDTGDFREDPSYQFRLKEGLDAIEASRAASGGLFSGATGQALNTRAQEEASQEFQNWFSRNYSLANMGMGAANQAGANSMRTADGVVGVRDRHADRTANIRLGTAGAVTDARDRYATNSNANIWAGAGARAGAVDTYSRGMNDAWTTYAGGTANALANIGNANAAGATGVGNAFSQGIGDAVFLDQYRRGQTATTANPGGTGLNWFGLGGGVTAS